MARQEHYTLGYSPVAVDFVGRRTLESHGAFFIPHLRPGMRVLDCGCGPGSMTLGIAARIGAAQAVGIDMDDSQIAIARAVAADRQVANVRFETASVYALPYEDASFDAIFSHALFEHLGEPLRAARECLRVLKPGGTIGVATPDWGGFIVEPMSPELAAAIAAYETHLARNGGNPRVGRKLAQVLAEAGFSGARAQSRYENYDPLTIIGEVMACQADEAGMPHHAAAFRRWQVEPLAMFSQAWVSCLARRAA